MYEYAKFVLDLFTPSRLALLDSYSVPVYISNSITQRDRILYLSTSGRLEASGVEPFAPPNLISSTAASFLSIIATHCHPGSTASTPKMDCTAIFLPFPHMPLPASKQLETFTLARSPSDTEWQTEIMQTAQQCLFEALHENPQVKWELSRQVKPKRVSLTAKQRRSAGEGDLYL